MKIILFKYIILVLIVKCLIENLKYFSKLRNNYYLTSTFIDFISFRIIKEFQKVAKEYITYYLPYTKKTHTIMKGVARKYPIHLKKILGTSIGKVINSRDMMGLIVFDYSTFSGNTTENMPKKLLLTMRFPSVLQTHNAKTLVDDRLWLTRCNGHISKRETRVLQDVDFYFRENFLQLYHAVIVEWVYFAAGRYSTKLLEEARYDFRYARDINDDNNENNENNENNDDNDNDNNDNNDHTDNTDNNIFDHTDYPDEESTRKDQPDLMYKRQKLRNMYKFLGAKFEIISLLIPTQKRTCPTSKNTCTFWFFFHLLYFVPFVHLVWV